jgi:hypothetical protein
MRKQLLTVFKILYALEEESSRLAILKHLIEQAAASDEQIVYNIDQRGKLLLNMAMPTVSDTLAVWMELMLIAVPKKTAEPHCFWPAIIYLFFF